MVRSKRNKSRHDSMVRKLSKEYKDKGYKVEADLKGLGSRILYGA